MNQQAAIGFGGEDYCLAVYVANRPPIDDYPALDHLRGLAQGELDHIVRHTSNHWRKLFSVYAKFLYEMGEAGLWEEAPQYSRWQDYRDQHLLQADSRAALLFSSPDFSPNRSSLKNSSLKNCVHVVAGKTYASALGLDAELQWLDAHFAVIPEKRLIVCPYFDYRQLSNERITRLIAYIREYWG